jgi:P27 family predicted phage terminase small subunit
MGSLGPAPLPTALKLLHGERRPSRLNRDEPRPPANAPQMPDDLAPAAQLVWRRVLETQAPGVILAAHSDVLRLYCEAVVRSEESAALLRQSGPLILDRHHGGAPVASPLHRIVRDNATLVRTLAGDLGLTPSSLSSVHAAPKPINDRMAALLMPRRTTS